MPRRSSPSIAAGPPARRPARRTDPPHRNDRAPDRTLRVGYVSPDFRAHPSARCSCSSPITTGGKSRSSPTPTCARPDELTRLKARADRGRHRGPERRPARRPHPRRPDRHPGRPGPAHGRQPHARLRPQARPRPGDHARPAGHHRPGHDGLSPDRSLSRPPGYERRRLHRAIDPAPALLLESFPPGRGAAGRPCRPSENGFVTFGCLNQLIKVTRPALELWRHDPPGTARLATGLAVTPRPPSRARSAALPGSGHRRRRASNSSRGPAEMPISAAISTSISPSTPSPTTATRALSTPSGWACR